jgi:YggT family protein
VAAFLGWVIQLYLLVLFGRAILSWFPLRPGTIWSWLFTICFELTEPVLRPVRRVVPPAGMFDLSFMVVILGLVLIRGIILS